MQIAAIFYDKMSQDLSCLFFSLVFFLSFLFSHPGGAASGFISHGEEFPPPCLKCIDLLLVDEVVYVFLRPCLCLYPISFVSFLLPFRARIS